MVHSAVQESVRTEMMTYSQAVQKSIEKNPEIRSVKKDCTKSFLMFGLPEEEKEDTSKVVDGVLECIGIKPKNEAVRIGLKTKLTSDDSTKPRPVKVSVGSSAHVFQILRAARNLKDSHNFEHVFLGPDRSVEERKIRRELVANLKMKRQDEPDKIHFIRGGKIVTSASSGLI